VEFLNAETPRPIQGEVIESFLEGREVKVLIGTSLLGEGVDLPSADALVYARGEKARVSLTQNAYRVGTATPGKTQALLVDFADRHNKHLMRHSLNRLEVYHAEDTFSVEVLQDPNGFLPWLREHSGEKVSD
jgi:superfamily II DNA or RNA helicase